MNEKSFPAKVFPGMGLFFAIGGSIIVAGATSLVAGKLTARKWLYVAEGAGLGLGLIVLAVLVAPWTAEEMVKNVFDLLRSLMRL